MSAETPAFAFTRKYNELMSDELVRNFMSKCVYDNATKDFDLKKTVEQVLPLWDATNQQHKGVAFATRTKIMLYISELFYYTITVQTTRMLGVTQPLLGAIPVEWWWEMSVRLRKLAIVATILEQQNLLSFGANPTPCDVPQPLTWLHRALAAIKPHFVGIEKEYIEQVASEPTIVSIYGFQTPK